MGWSFSGVKAMSKVLGESTEVISGGSCYRFCILLRFCIDIKFLLKLE